MKFSIIIPCYNCKPYIRECLDSVVLQTFSDWECICIDDGSTDGSGGILDQYAARDNRFVVVHKANGGEGSARNAGLDRARGEWIAYLDSDDIYEPCFLEAAVNMSEKYPCAEMVNFGQYVFEDGSCTRRELPLVTKETCLGASSLLPSRVFNTGFFQTVYSRSEFGDLRFCNYKIGADRVYTFQCLKRAKYIAESPIIAYGYRLRDGSAMRSRMTFQKRWHRFLFALRVAGAIVGIRTSIRTKVRYIRPVFGNFMDLIRGVR